MSRQDANAAFARTSFLYGGNADYIENLYARYETDPGAVDAEWQAFFQSLKDDRADVMKSANGPSWQRPHWPQLARGELVSALDGDWQQVEKALGDKVKARAQAGGVEFSSAQVQQATRNSIRALMLIRAYRARGHFYANLDPLGLEPHRNEEDLDPRSYGFTDADMDRPIFLDRVLGLEFGTLREILAILRRTYCQTLGVEFMHISNPAQKSWIQERIEGPDKEITFTREGKRAILTKLIEAEGFEKFCDLKFTGTKRFGLDGGESMIPALEQIIKRGGALGVRDICIGMAHRGRLNVLAQVMGKPQRAIFHEFRGGSSTPNEVEGSGDVKYHLGASSDREFDGNRVHLSLTANPSHLEIVNPVVLGKVRAKQDQLGATREDRTMVMPLLISGDAAFAGQGVIAECFGLSGLRGHRTGGSVHFIINNQIGFTTYPRYSRSSPYPSDVAKMIEAPIFHANGDDPEAVVFAAKVATEFRQKFQSPVVIDMFCYRRFGHNEGDEPSFTQPLMYKAIRKHPTTADIYAKKLVGENVVTDGEVEKIRADWRARLDIELEASQGYKPNSADWLDGRWADIKAARDADDPRRGRTGEPLARLKDIGAKITAIPPGSTRTGPSSVSWKTAARRSKPARASTGRRARRSHSARCCSKAIRCGSPARTPSAARSRSAIRCWSTRRTRTATSRSITWTSARPASRSSIRCSRRRRCWASNTATRWPSRTRSRCGRRSSATSPTARRSSSTSSFPRASASGCACRGSSACCRTATKGRGRNTPRRGSSATFRCAPRTTCRSPTVRRLPTTSTSCAGSSKGTSGSRSS